jgi:hypothetical protein
MMTGPLLAVELGMSFSFDYKPSLVGFEPRCQLLLDVTCETLRNDPDLWLCEGLRLIEATRTAIARLSPASLETFDARVLPLMRQMLMDRFGVPECCIPAGVN